MSKVPLYVPTVLPTVETYAPPAASAYTKASIRCRGRVVLPNIGAFFRQTVNLILTSVYDRYSGSMKITTHLDHISHCETASGTNLGE